MKIATVLQIMFSCAISGTAFCGVLLSRDQHHWYQFRLDMSHPCSGSTVEVSPFSVIDQKLHATMSHLTQNIWEIQDRLVLAKREYERTIFQNNEDLIAQYETADDLTESYNIGENCEVSIVLETVERIMKIKTEFANEDCEIFMPVWASETYLNILNNLVSKVEVKRKSPKEDTYKEETVMCNKRNCCSSK